MITLGASIPSVTVIMKGWAAGMSIGSLGLADRRKRHVRPAEQPTCWNLDTGHSKGG